MGEGCGARCASSHERKGAPWAHSEPGRRNPPREIAFRALARSNQAPQSAGRSPRSKGYQSLGQQLASLSTGGRARTQSSGRSFQAAQQARRAAAQDWVRL
uniref:Uncharacterized protein n=1 Tax=Rangifer tarandus platyrhynchus TaxID=3082113 RepID=A0ACB0DQT8_RANTA|nr:unnamed protein product [Rangifer tarandus platyrhynchus]